MKGRKGRLEERRREKNRRIREKGRGKSTIVHKGKMDYRRIGEERKEV